MCVYVYARKLNIRRNQDNVNLIEPGRTVIVHLFYLNDEENFIYHNFLIIYDKFLSLLLYYKGVILFEQSINS